MSLLCFGISFVLFVSANTASLGWIHQCQNNEFQCHSDLTCIDSVLKCDDEFDCNDHSDEENCFKDAPFTCKVDEFRCKSSNQCISSSWVCDTEQVRTSTSNRSFSSLTKIYCNFSSANYCNFSNHSFQDCFDNSDEENCSNDPKTFACDNGRYIRLAWKCGM